MTYGPGYGGQPQPQGPTPQGYGAQGYGQQQPGYAMASPTPAATPAPGKGIPFYLTLAVAFIGVVNFFLGFTPFWSGGGESQNFFKTLGVVGLVPLLGAAVVAGFGLLPEQPKSEVVAAALSVTGCLTLLFLLVFKPEGQGTGMGMILVLILSFIQAGFRGRHPPLPRGHPQAAATAAAVRLLRPGLWRPRLRPAATAGI